MQHELQKKKLSNLFLIEIKEEFIAKDKKGNHLHLDIELSRSEFEEIIQTEIQKTINYCKKALKEAKITTENLGKILLVGGCSKMPIIKKSLEKEFGKEIFSYINPQENVALGAAIQAAIISGNNKIDTALVDICPHTLGIEVADFDRRGFPVTDKFAPIIPKNTVIPTTIEERFFTMFEDQKEVKIIIYQGENPIASQNELIDKMVLKFDLSEKDPEILVRFDYDLNGIINISVREKFSKKKNTLILSKLGQKYHAKSNNKKETNIIIDKELTKLLEKLKKESTKNENQRYSNDINNLLKKLL